MAQPPKKKKVVVTTSSKSGDKSSAASFRKKSIQSDSNSTELVFGKKNFTLMLIGIGLIAVGLLLMTGGSMPDPNTWDENIIYSKRRTLLAPIVILAGLVVQFFAIFRK